MDNLPVPPHNPIVGPQTIDLTVPIPFAVCLQNLEKWGKRPNVRLKLKSIPSDPSRCAFSFIFNPRILRDPTEFDVQGELSQQGQNTRITGVGKLSKAAYSSLGCITLFMGVPGIGLPLLVGGTAIAVFMAVLILLMVVVNIWSGHVSLKEFIASIPRILNGERYL